MQHSNLRFFEGTREVPPEQRAPRFPHQSLLVDGHRDGRGAGLDVDRSAARRLSTSTSGCCFCCQRNLDLLTAMDDRNDLFMQGVEACESGTGGR
jgi:hypothetical protein